jgi:hypothetical protein
VFYGFYAVSKYSYNARFGSSIILSGLGIGALIKLGLYSSNKDMSVYYHEIYEKYKDEVINPKYRGLKLYNSKKAY